jgi:hypothetical protein
MFIINHRVGSVMGGRKTIITVSLTTQAAEYLDFLAEKQTKGNRSRWVQTAILKAMQRNIGREAAHVAPESGRVHGDQGDKCNPNHRSGRCEICWGEE